MAMTFWFVWKYAAIEPASSHCSREEAIAEAVRVANETGRPAYVYSGELTPVSEHKADKVHEGCCAECGGRLEAHPLSQLRVCASQFGWRESTGDIEARRAAERKNLEYQLSGSHPEALSSPSASP